MRDDLIQYVLKHSTAKVIDGFAPGDDGGALQINNLRIVCSWGMGWEHVSVSTRKHCPFWDEMAYVKALFWKDEEAVMQLHLPQSEYVNNHPYCLHLWRPIGAEIPLPPRSMVGLLEVRISDEAIRTGVIA